MASPHVAGVAALYLEATPTASSAQVFAWVRDAATEGVVTGAGAGSPNRLLYTDPALDSATPTPGRMPTAAAT